MVNFQRKIPCKNLVHHPTDSQPLKKYVAFEYHEKSPSSNPIPGIGWMKPRPDGQLHADRFLWCVESQRLRVDSQISGERAGDALNLKHAVDGSEIPRPTTVWMEINPIDNWDKPTIFNWCKNFVHQQYDDIQGRLLSWSYLRSMSVCGQKASVENDSPPSLLETLRLGGERASWQMPKNRCRELFRTHAAINDWSMMFWCFYPNCIVGYIGYFRLISGMIIRALHRTVTFIFDESGQ